MTDRSITEIKQHCYKVSITCILLSFICLSTTSNAAEELEESHVENSLFSFRLKPRTPEQMVAFYEARGFPKSALNLIKKTCYLTGIVHNKSTDTIWLELKYWRFYTDQREIKRFDRRYWNAQWDWINLPPAYRSTFRWTLIPETLDYLPGEEEGGNILLPFTKDFISVRATFSTGENKQGKKITISTDNLFCAEDTQ